MHASIDRVFRESTCTVFFADVLQHETYSLKGLKQKQIYFFCFETFIVFMVYLL